MVGRKQVKKLLVEIGFHFCGGYFISNDNKDYRIIVKKKSLALTKTRNSFWTADSILFNELNYDEVTEKIKYYFSTPDNEIKWDRIFNKQALIGANYHLLKEFLIKNYSCPEKLS